MLILAGSKSKVLGQKVARTLGVAPVEYESKRFPDSSFYAKLMDPASVKGQEIAIIQSCIRDEDIIELLVLQEMVKENGARGIITIVPYFGGYARQDKVFQPGEPVSARALAKLFQIYSDQVITVDVHSELVSRFFENKMINLSPAEPVAEYLKKHDVNWVIAPDAGARSRAERISSLMGVQTDYIKKKRIDSYTVEMDLGHIHVQGESVAIVDDIISTGGTMLRAVEELRKKGARNVYAVCTHGLFGIFHRDIIPSLKKFNVVCTDTIETELSMISVSGVISGTLRRF